MRNYLKEWYIRNNYYEQRRRDEISRFRFNTSEISHIFYLNFWKGWGIDKWTKKNIYLEKDGKRDIFRIITNYNITRDTSILWKTTGKSVRSALRMGELKPQALTSRAIKALGNYYKKRAKRIVRSRIISYLDSEKRAIVDMAQDRYEHLQELERFLGRFIFDPENFSQAVIKSLRAYIDKRKADDFQENYIAIRKANYFKSDEKFSERFLSHILSQDNLREYLACDIAAAEELIQLIQKNSTNKAWLQEQGNEAILLFIRTRVEDATRDAQGLNQMLVHSPGSGGNLRGDLNNCIDDAMKYTRDHRQDWHCPVTEDHQLIYPDDKSVTIDSDFHTNGSREALDDLALVVSEVVGDNTSLDHEKGKIKVTSATKWLNYGNLYDRNPYKFSLLHSLSHFFGECWNLLIAPLNLFETIIFGHNASWAASLRYSPKTADIKDHTNYYALSYHIKQRTLLSTKVGLIIHKTINNLIWEGLAKGFYEGFMKFLSFPFDLWADFTKQESTPEDILRELIKELGKVEREHKRIIKGAEQRPTLEGAKCTDAQEDDFKDIYMAQPDISLHPYHSHGMLNSAVDGFTSFVDFFGHNMFAKQPFTSLVSSFGAVVSFLAFFAPKLAVAMMGPGYTKFLTEQGFIWTTEVYSAAFAGSFTNFKLMGLALEAVEHGPDSWLSTGVSHVIKDPAAIIAYTTMAWFLGYAAVYLVKIPGISHHLKAHIGNPEQLSEIFGGAKIGVGGYHLLSVPHQVLEKASRDYVNEWVQNYKDKYNQEASDESIARLATDVLELVALIKQGRYPFSKMRNNPDIALLLILALRKEDLQHLSPPLKAKLQYILPILANSNLDAAGIEKTLDPNKYAPQSTLRGYIGRLFSYMPLLIRCVLSFFSLLVVRSKAAFVRPWKELGGMVQDDLTSTAEAIHNLASKIFETVFNRLPRTIADVLVNSVFARVASFFGYHRFTFYSYRISAGWDIAQEKLHANTAGYVMNKLVRANTTPNSVIGLQNAIRKNIGKKPSRTIFDESIKPKDLPAVSSDPHAVAQTLRVAVK